MLFSSSSRPSNLDVTAAMTSDGLLDDNGCDAVFVEKGAIAPPPVSLRCRTHKKGPRHTARVGRVSIAPRECGALCMAAQSATPLLTPLLLSCYYHNTIIESTTVLQIVVHVPCNTSTQYDTTKLTSITVCMVFILS